MTLLLILLAVLPTIFMIVFIYYKDSYEKEPVGLLVSLFALGMAGTIPAVAYETAGDAFIGLFFYKNSGIYNLISAFLGVALVEEGVKFIALYFRTWKNHNIWHIHNKSPYILHLLHVTELITMLLLSLPKVHPPIHKGYSQLWQTLKTQAQHIQCHRIYNYN